MANIFIRDLSDETKQRLNDDRLRKAILEEALKPQEKTWFDMLRECVDDVGGVELELPERHPFREPELSFEV